MDKNYRIHVTIRPQSGSVFNSYEFCTEEYSVDVEQAAINIGLDVERWIVENINAAEEY